MASELWPMSPTRLSARRFGKPSFEDLMLAVLLLLASTQLSQASPAWNGTANSSNVDMWETTMPMKASTTSPHDHGGTDYANLLRELVPKMLSSIPVSLKRKLLQADVRPECMAGLLRAVRGFQNLEPWVFRLFDASGKYPTGLLEGAHVDMGAFDECIGTVVRDGFGNVLSEGQYCNMLVYVNNVTAIQEMIEPLLKVMHPRLKYFREYLSTKKIAVGRLAICFLNDCNRQDMQTILGSVTPPFVRIEVSNCVTGKPHSWSQCEIGIVAFLCVLLIAVATATYVDCNTSRDSKFKKAHGALFDLVTGFSVTSNTRALLRVADKAKPDQYALQFLHGMRFFGIVHIVLGHCGSIMSDTWSGMLNLFTLSERWSFMIITAGFSSVDTFFFLSGFFLCFTIMRQKRTGHIVFIIGVTRRLIRTCIPMFFIIMCLYALDPFIDGPNTKAYFQNLHNDVSSNWWRLILQIRNFYTISVTDVVVHVWYLSTDFQLFAVSLVVLLILKRRKILILATFIFLSLLGCVVSTCVVAGFHLPPFMIFPGPIPDLMLRTLDEYYIRPYYHAVCYFGGCLTYLILEDFRKAMVSKNLQRVGWYGTVASSLFCVFVKFAWYTSPDPVPVGVALLAAFLDRILWTLFLAWITLACSTGRGGALTKLLSWNAYVPLSKLSFGVYLIHVPFLHLWFYSSRERRYWSVFNQITLLFALLVWSFLLSYLAFLVCEAPTAALDKLIFTKLTGGSGKKQATISHESTNHVKTQHENNYTDSCDVKTQKNGDDCFVSRC